MRDDFELLAAWGDGDRAAGSELFDRHFHELYGFFRNKVVEGAQDLVQQTFLVCVETRDRFEGRSTFRAYMFGTARNVLRHHLRKLHRDRKDPDFSVESVCDHQPSPSAVLALRGEKRVLLEALRQIPIDYQIALELYHWEGLTGPELAEALDLKEPGVRSRLRRATEALRRKVADLSASAQQLESTMAGLTDWARELRDHMAATG